MPEATELDQIDDLRSYGVFARQPVQAVVQRGSVQTGIGRRGINSTRSSAIRAPLLSFAYDYEAYAEVKRNLGRLIASRQLRLALQLAPELMKRGTYQVEMRDEGLMTEDIDSGLSVVIEAVAIYDLPSEEALAWCSAMLAADRTGFIARKPLEVLRGRLQAAHA
jgi:hypothetical protein